MYRVYQNQAAAAFSYVYFFIFLALQFSNIKIFVVLFSGTVRLIKLKLTTHVDNEWMYRLYRNQAAASYLSLIFLSLQCSKIKNICHTFFQEL